MPKQTVLLLSICAALGATTTAQFNFGGFQPQPQPQPATFAPTNTVPAFQPTPGSIATPGLISVGDTRVAPVAGAPTPAQPLINQAPVGFMPNTRFIPTTNIPNNLVEPNLIPIPNVTPGVPLNTAIPAVNTVQALPPIPTLPADINPVPINANGNLLTNSLVDNNGLINIPANNNAQFDDLLNPLHINTFNPNSEDIVAATVANGLPTSFTSLLPGVTINPINNSGVVSLTDPNVINSVTVQPATVPAIQPTVAPPTLPTTTAPGLNNIPQPNILQPNIPQPIQPGQPGQPNFGATTTGFIDPATGAFIPIQPTIAVAPNSAAGTLGGVDTHNLPTATSAVSNSVNLVSLANEVRILNVQRRQQSIQQ